MRKNSRSHTWEQNTFGMSDFSQFAPVCTTIPIKAEVGSVSTTSTRKDLTLCALLPGLCSLGIGHRWAIRYTTSFFVLLSLKLVRTFGSFHLTQRKATVGS